MTSNCFELYDESIGSFTISCHIITNTKANNSEEFHTSINKNDKQYRIDFKEKFISVDGNDGYSWEAVIGNKFLLCTYIYENEYKDSIELKTEIEKVLFCLSSIRIIVDTERESVLNSYRFNQFMTSYAASVDLLQRAYDNGSAIEITVLLSNQIDALLRLILILKIQLDNNSNTIDTTLIYQQEDDKPVMEKQVYKMALQNNIINKDLFDKLYTLYDQRNKVIHRYIITDLLTKSVFHTAHQYSLIEKEIGKIVKEYEQKQYKAKIGIYGVPEPPDKPLTSVQQDEFLNALKEKHSHMKINDEITFKKFDTPKDDENIK
ncbi:hypothetical protein [Chryseobacterium sp. KLBC 52]|uniref:hypothetical protein n=1 Tax=Chryseobacterium sp. KLBC 52 TaxID=1862702 RepID=UPI000E0A778A|nr:hypothetical protein [Chryseobacterium sp. KLBC 52]